jgi:diguanylate cyclase (GGDEF)-like protein/PAS domain S-box-containing protein
MTLPSPRESPHADAMSAPTQLARAAANTWAYVFLAGTLAAMPLVAWRLPVFNLSISEGNALAYQAIAEALYVAGALSIFGVAWFSPRGEFRLRPTLVACLALAVGMFDLLHFVAYPGVANASPIDGYDGSFLLECLSRVVMPTVLMALVLAPRAAVLPARLRWSLLSGTLAVILPLAWVASTLPNILPGISFSGTVSSGQWLVVCLNTAAAVLAMRRRNDQSPDWRIIAAALLGAISEACFLFAAATDADGIAGIFGHVYGILSMSAAFIAVYDEAVSHPYSELELSRVDALAQKERIEAIFRSVADGVIVVDRRLTVIAMNPVARNLTGTGVANPEGMPLAQALESIDTKDEGSIAAAVRACLRRGRLGTATCCPPAQCGPRTERAVEHSISPITDQRGRIQGAVVVLRDVSERSRLQRQLVDAADYARNLIETSLDVMMVIDMDGLITDVNRAAETATGTTRSQLVGSHFSASFSAPDSAHKALERLFPDGIVRDLPLAIARPDAIPTQVSCNITPYRDAAGQICGAFVVARDVTEMRQVQTMLEFQASHDALTALPNRRRFHEHIQRSMAESGVSGRPVAVMLLDIDDFKDVNDTLGHAAGDELLQTIAGRLAQCLRATDTVARLGGDEFAMLIDDFEQVEDIHRIADKVLQTVTAPIQLDGNEVTVSCSIGVSVFPHDPGDADSLLRNADTALYRAKESGKNKWQCFAADMNVAVQRRVDLGNRLRSALKRGEFSLQFQPQIGMPDARIIGVEALLRWTTDGLGSVSPAEFIPIAENTGLIIDIGHWVLEEACRQTAAWCSSIGAEISVSVNLSARQFRDQDLVGTVARALAETGLPPHLLVLELTESMLMRDAIRAAETLSSLKKTGVRIAIDDFGTGYSSLSYLKRFPLDYLKIDRSFVTDIPGDPNDEAIVRSIIALAHSLKLKVIAEGVETHGQMVHLRELDCDEIQGYYFSRPRVAGDILQLLENGLPQHDQPSQVTTPREPAPSCL